MSSQENIENVDDDEDYFEESSPVNPYYSPELIIEDTNHKDKIFRVIRDDYLIGGTKQRGMVPLLENSVFEEFVYAGPNNGYAQIALAYAAKMTRKNCTLFVAKIGRDHAFTIKARKMGAKIIKVPNGFLKTVQRAADKYVESKENAQLIPFGGNSVEFVNYMISNIRNALPDDIRKSPPKRMWLVGGSGTLLKILYQVFPETEFHVVQVGKKLWDDQLELERTTKYISPEKFCQKAELQPPYPTVATYDAKLWVFVAQHGQAGDYIWNVAKD